MTEPAARVSFAPTTLAAPPGSRPAGGGSASPRPPAAAVAAGRPGAGLVPAARPATIARPVRRPVPGPSVLTRLARLLRGGRARAGQLTAQDVRVLVYLGVAGIIAFGGQIDLNAPSAGVPDRLPDTTLATAGAPAAAPAGGGLVDDPTSRGRITETTAHGLAEIQDEMGPALRGASCWDAHAWNPSSDHAKGKACDFWTCPAGEFARGDGLASGNRLVAWLRANAGPLQVKYVIWQGRIWSPELGDRIYTGGGVYDVRDPTGGHFDHLHVSFRR